MQIASINKEQHNHKQACGNSGPCDLSSSCEYDSHAHMVCTAECHNHIIETWDFSHDCIHSRLKSERQTHVVLVLFHLNHDNNELCLASAGSDANAHVLDVSSSNKKNNALKSTLKGHASTTRAMEIIHATATTTHDDQTTMLITSSDDCTIKSWSMHNLH